MHRHEARLREISLTNIIEHNAKTGRACQCGQNTAPIEAYDHQLGQQVGVWLEPAHKDDPRGWRGPGNAATINAEEGNVSVRYRGRTLDRKMQELRPLCSEQKNVNLEAADKNKITFYSH